MKISFKINTILIIILSLFSALFFLAIQFYELSRRDSKVEQLINYHIDRLIEDSQVIISNMLLEQHEAINLYFDRIQEKDKNIISVYILNDDDFGDRFKGELLSCQKQNVFYEKNQNSFSLYYKLKFGNNEFGILTKKILIENEGLFLLRDYRKIIIFLTSALLVQVYVLSLLIKHTTIKPLKLICKQLQPLKNGDYNINLSKQSSEEFEFLVDNITSIIIDLKKYHEEKIRNKNLAAIGNSASMIAHDIRRPFSSLRALLDILSQKKDDKNFISEAMKEIDHLLSSTDAMLEELIEFARHSEPEKKPYNLQPLIISAIVSMFRTETYDLDIRLHYSFHHTKAVYCNRGKIIRVFQNIIENAGQALEGKGNIYIETRDLNDNGQSMLEIIISNNGPQIPDEVVLKLFDPFFSKGKKNGTGLGLAICHKIVSMHGGRVYAKSLPQRTSFIVIIPSYELITYNHKDDLIHHTREIRPLLRTPVRHSYRLESFYKLHLMRGKSSSLLIVDDEPLYRESLRTIIDGIAEIRHILRVVEASNGENALALFEKENFDYVVSDIDMGKNRMNGYAFVRKLLSNHKNVIAVIHSNKRQSDMYETLRNIPRMQGFLPKPMNREDLLVFLSGERVADCNKGQEGASEGEGET